MDNTVKQSSECKEIFVYTFTNINRTTRTEDFDTEEEEYTDVVVVIDKQNGRQALIFQR